MGFKNRIPRLAMVAAVLVAGSFGLRGAAPAKAPEFTLAAADGSTYSSAAHKGHRIVISFYKGYY
jgi:hypothetical protein